MRTDSDSREYRIPPDIRFGLWLLSLRRKGWSDEFAAIQENPLVIHNYGPRHDRIADHGAAWLPWIAFLVAEVILFTLLARLGIFSECMRFVLADAVLAPFGAAVLMQIMVMRQWFRLRWSVPVDEIAVTRMTPREMVLGMIARPMALQFVTYLLYSLGLCGALVFYLLHSGGRSEFILALLTIPLTLFLKIPIGFSMMFAGATYAIRARLLTRGYWWARIRMMADMGRWAILPIALSSLVGVFDAIFLAYVFAFGIVVVTAIRLLIAGSTACRNRALATFRQTVHHSSNWWFLAGMEMEPEANRARLWDWMRGIEFAHPRTVEPYGWDEDGLTSRRRATAFAHCSLPIRVGLRLLDGAGQLIVQRTMEPSASKLLTDRRLLFQIKRRAPGFIWLVWFGILMGSLACASLASSFHGGLAKEHFLPASLLLGLLIVGTSVIAVQAAVFRIANRSSDLWPPHIPIDCTLDAQDNVVATILLPTAINLIAAILLPGAIILIMILGWLTIWGSSALLGSLIALVLIVPFTLQGGMIAFRARVLTRSTSLALLRMGWDSLLLVIPPLPVFGILCVFVYALQLPTPLIGLLFPIPLVLLIVLYPITCGDWFQDLIDLAPFWWERDAEEDWREITGKKWVSDWTGPLREKILRENASSQIGET
ncbi:hypothetical protein KQI84_03255 [bacterium]|nr:hypothetical protein [bacterium]